MTNIFMHSPSGACRVSPHLSVCLSIFLLPLPICAVNIVRLYLMFYVFFVQQYPRYPRCV